MRKLTLPDLIIELALNLRVSEKELINVLFLLPLNKEYKDLLQEAEFDIMDDDSDYDLVKD